MKPAPIVLEVVQSDEVLDLDAWVRTYVGIVQQLDPVPTGALAPQQEASA